MASKKTAKPKPTRSKAKPTKTTNWLHMEDLDPRRFEDLIRQLIYDFKSWQRLEPYGRLGDDGGIDILGVESPGRSAAVEDEDVAEEEQTEAPQRDWRIQCKRYKGVGPDALRKIVREVVPDAKMAPYGLVIATACDVSAKGFEAFHDEARKQGVQEHILWSRTIIEDLLYKPANDHLLFAYFGISFQVRRRGRLTEIRRRIALKRKLLRAFGLKAEDFAGSFGQDLLVRDIDDETFPYGSDNRIRLPGLAATDPSHECRFFGFHPQGLWVERYSYSGWLKSDGTWDIVDESRGATGYMSSTVRYELEVQEGRSVGPGSWSRFADRIPSSDSVLVYESRLIPWERVLEVEPFGEPMFVGVHLLCQFEGPDGPYGGRPLHTAKKIESTGYVRTTNLDAENRRPLYEELDAMLKAEAAAIKDQPSGEG